MNDAIINNKYTSLVAQTKSTLFGRVGMEDIASKQMGPD